MLFLVHLIVALAQQPLSISVANVPMFSNDGTYDGQVLASGGFTGPPYTFTAVGLPLGLGMDASTGALFVAPGDVMLPGSSSLSFSVSDGVSTVWTTLVPLVVGPNDGNFICSFAPPFCELGVACNVPIACAGSTSIGPVSPFVCSLQATSPNPLPAGLSFNNVSPNIPRIAGTPSGPLVLELDMSVSITAASGVAISFPLPVWIFPRLVVDVPYLQPYGEVSRFLCCCSNLIAN
jgi:hypothetical protein